MSELDPLDVAPPTPPRHKPLKLPAACTFQLTLDPQNPEALGRNEPARSIRAAGKHSVLSFLERKPKHARKGHKQCRF